MQLKDKIILVVYIPDDKITQEFMCQIRDCFDGYIDESAACIMLPTAKKSDYRVECINPVLLNEDKYAEVEETVNKFKMKVNELFKEK